MWMQDTYEGYQGKYWQLPPRKILPKPYKRPHPPMWYAAGNTSSYEMCAHKGLGVLGFSVQSLEEMAAVVEAYKSAIVTAEPVGAFVNDNVMITTAAYVREDADTAIRDMVASRPSYLQSNVYRYHDTFPHPDWVPKWPDLLPDMTEDMARGALGGGGMVMGTPDHALAACTRWESAGADQLVFGIGPDSSAGTLETIRLIGEHVIPKLDKDPVHRTTRFREAAAAREPSSAKPSAAS
jgi:alkanesulfonate monooxygenase SsuD/methylene tetrahydromethanopterin reductase-like flavin-dependent oxidoreductase (luciferase family)